MPSPWKDMRPTQNGDPRDDPKPKRGFASMDPKRVKEISSMGGKEAHRKGVAHKWSKDEARVAGIKGGRTSAMNRRRSKCYP